MEIKMIWSLIPISIHHFYDIVNHEIIATFTEHREQKTYDTCTDYKKMNHWQELHDAMAQTKQTFIYCRFHGNFLEECFQDLEHIAKMIQMQKST